MGPAIQRTLLSAALAGFVAAQQNCPVACTLIFAPVCGGDGNFYASPCNLEAKACLCNDCFSAVPNCDAACTTDGAMETLCGIVGENTCQLTTCEGFLSGTNTPATNGTATALTSSNCTKQCPAILAPVCSSDGQTYSNECVFNFQTCDSGSNATIVHNGECSSSQGQAATGDACNGRCPRNIRPVCGSDGQTYDNECLLDFAICQAGGELTKVADGECPTGTAAPVFATDVAPIPLPLTCSSEDCSKILRPVCGSDGQTYNNECLLNAASCQAGGGLTLVADGECPTAADLPNMATDVAPIPLPLTCSPGDCSKILRPVCGSDGQTYDNECMLNAAADCSGGMITFSHEGACDMSTSEASARGDVGCATVCPLILAPVCGTDGITYPSVCQLQAAACKDGISIDVASTGSCAEDSVAADAPDTSATRSPTDLSAVAPTTTIPTDNIAPIESNSAPASNCITACTRNLAPVCASDGLTYRNRCMFEAMACETNSQVTIVHEGMCASLTPTPTSVPAATAATLGLELQAQSVLENNINVSNSMDSGCSTMCPRIANPVCGSDGKTYFNQCVKEQAACLTATNIVAVSQGACEPAAEQGIQVS